MPTRVLIGSNIFLITYGKECFLSWYYIKCNAVGGGGAWTDVGGHQLEWSPPKYSLLNHHKTLCHWYSFLLLHYPTATMQFATGPVCQCTVCHWYTMPLVQYASGTVAWVILNPMTGTGWICVFGAISGHFAFLVRSEKCLENGVFRIFLAHKGKKANFKIGLKPTQNW